MQSIQLYSFSFRVTTSNNEHSIRKMSLTAYTEEMVKPHKNSHKEKKYNWNLNSRLDILY
jgi:hypothetical protein